MQCAPPKHQKPHTGDKLLHPRLVRTVRLQGKNVASSSVNGAMLFVCIYAVFFLFFTLLLAAENHDLETAATSALAIISNVGPGLGAMGPLGNFSHFSPLAKWTFSFGMFASRLEFYPILILFAPSLWRGARRW